MTDTRREEIITRVARDRIAAHRAVFAHRHQFENPPFHVEILDAWHDPANPRIVTEAFRGAAKSTLAEEWITLRACLREFRNGIIVGANEDRAMERLQAVKHELDTNEHIADLFGGMRGSIWTGHKIELTNGVVIQAIGRGQSMRGLKHNDARPDLCLIDDLEDEDTVATKEQREKLLSWLYRTVLPALEPGALVRFIGNRLDPEAVIVKVAGNKRWLHQKYPIEHVDPSTGERTPTWPGKFPLSAIDGLRQEYIEQGLGLDFNCEYMCEADNPADKPFKPETIRVAARVRAWEAAYAMFDPARTVNRRSAATGYACWSYVGHKIVVWDGWQRMLMPDEIIAEIFACDEHYHPVVIGFEEDGLSEWAMQPLRARQIQLGRALPLRPMKAPDSKIDFIRGMQPFFAAREVEFAQPLPDLRASLLNFPSGQIDAANALAYMLKMRPGAPIYHEFQHDHVAFEVPAVSGETCWLAVNATPAYTTGVLLQCVAGQLRVMADWVLDGDPGQTAVRLVQAARLEFGGAVRAVAPAIHWDRWKGVGLPPAMGAALCELKPAGEMLAGREQVRKLLTVFSRGLPAVQIAERARWTLNGFAGGYARGLARGGIVTEEPAEGAYRTLMEGLEAWAGLLAAGRTDEDSDSTANFRYSADGRRYRSAMVQR